MDVRSNGIALFSSFIDKLTYGANEQLQQQVMSRKYTNVSANGDGISLTEVLKMISPSERKAIIDKTEKTNGIRPYKDRYKDSLNVSREGKDAVKPVVAIEFCKVFDSKQGCNNKACKKLHVCRHFVKGKCTFGSKCKKPHHFDDAHTRYILQQHRLDGLTHSQLKEFLCRNVQFALDDSVDEASLPKQLEICKYYNVAIGCSREGQCPFLHVCRFFAEEGTCKFGQKCIRKHNFCNEHAQKLLLRYKLNEHNALVFLRRKVDALRTESPDELDLMNLTSRPFANITNGKSDFKKPRARSLDILEKDTFVNADKGLPRKHSEPALALLSEEVIHICENGLVGNCRIHHCPLMHRKMPFCWQYSTNGTIWKDVDDRENQKIEAKFVDVRSEDVIVRLEERHEFVFKFSQLIGIQKNNNYSVVEGYNIATPVVVHIRRLSTPSALGSSELHAQFRTQWIWYYLDETGKWKSYDDVDDEDHDADDGLSIVRKKESHINSAAIEIAFTDPRRNSFQFRRGTKRFVLDFEEMTQENVETKRLTRVRRRPKHLNTLIEEELDRDEEETVTEKSFFPSYWKTAAPNGMVDGNFGICELLELTPTSREYKKVFKDIKRSLKHCHIEKIAAVQNPSLWMTYTMKRDEIAELNSTKAEERSLYCAASFENAENICRYGFDGYSNFGVGLKDGKFFAKEARLANRGNIPNQAGLFVMFLCKVLTVFSETKRLSVQEALAEGYSPFDDLSMYHVFDPDKVYPEFILLFKF